MAVLSSNNHSRDSNPPFRILKVINSVPECGPAPLPRHSKYWLRQKTTHPPNATAGRIGAIRFADEGRIFSP